MCFIRVLIIGIILNTAGHSDGKQPQWRYTTACYGSDPACSGYTIECRVGERIVIGSLKYGGKSSPNKCQFGIADCQDTLTIQNITRTIDKWCCTYNPNDYLKDFNSENRTAVVTNCNGQQKCSGRVPRKFDFSYSSYVRMQYACIKDNSIEMCSNRNKSGPDIFVTFNLSQGYSFPSLNGSRDCTCQVHTLDCSSRLDLELLALDLSLTGSSMNQACSSAYLELTPTGKFTCEWRNNLVLPVVYSNESWINTIALRHLFLNGSLDKPGSVVIRVKAVNGSSPVSLTCYQPGVEPIANARCRDTASTSAVTSDRSTSIWSSRLSRIVTNSIIDQTTQPGFEETTSSLYSSQSIETIPSTTSNAPTPSITDKTHQNLETKLTKPPKDFSSLESVSVSSTTVSQSQYTTSSENSLYKTSSLSSTVHETYTSSESQTFSLSKETFPNLPYTKTGESFTTVPMLSTTTKRNSDVSSKLTSETSEISTLATRDHINTTTIDSVEKSNTFTFSVILPYESANSSNKTETPTVAPVTDHTTLMYMTTGVERDDTDNKRLIIGLTVGAVLVVILVVAVVAFCCFIRLKKKEKVERNYVSNTSIFYSFPEEYYVTENMSYEPAETDTDEIEDLRTSSRDYKYDTVNHHSPTLKTHPNETTLYIDNYKIKHPVSYPSEYQRDTENRTMMFVNGTEPEMMHYADNNGENSGFRNVNVEKGVSFDPSSLYSTVKKEGKTKF